MRADAKLGEVVAQDVGVNADIVMKQLKHGRVTAWTLYFSEGSCKGCSIFYSLSGHYFVNLEKKIMQKPRPHIINSALLWEYDLETFNYEKSYKIVIERILQLGNLDEWRNMVKFYTKEQILETIEWSAQLEQRDKDFSRFFLTSEFLHAA